MANQSDVVYKCIGDPKEVRSLYKIINANDKRKTSRVKNGFGTLFHHTSFTISKKIKIVALLHIATLCYISATFNSR